MGGLGTTIVIGKESCSSLIPLRCSCSPAYSVPGPGQVTILWCKSCGRYLQPPKHWLKADLGEWGRRGRAKGQRPATAGSVTPLAAVPAAIGCSGLCSLLLQGAPGNRPPPETPPPAESKELLTYCIKRVKGLQKVKLVDAAFIWTEPHRCAGGTR